MAFSSSFFSSVLVQCLCHLCNACASQWAECILCCSLVSFFFLLPCPVSLGTKELLFSSLWTGCLLCCAVVSVSLCVSVWAIYRTATYLSSDPCRAVRCPHLGLEGHSGPVHPLRGINWNFRSLLDPSLLHHYRVYCMLYSVWSVEYSVWSVLYSVWSVLYSV